MLTFLNRHLMHPFMAWRAGSKHLKHLRELRRTQFDPPAVIRQRQLAALQVQLRHAYDTVPYYRAAWDKAGVHPADVKSLADLEAFPVLTKADIRRHERALVSSAFDITKLRVKRTSGSTGVPLTDLHRRARGAVEDGLHAAVRRVERLATRAAGGEGVGQPRIPALRAEGPAAELPLRPRRLPRHARTSTTNASPSSPGRSAGTGRG